MISQVHKEFIVVSQWTTAEIGVGLTFGALEVNDVDEHSGGEGKYTQRRIAYR